MIFRGLAAALAALVFIGAPAGDADAKRASRSICQWFGTAPICRGVCPKGWTPMAYDKKGDGKKCFSGTKAKCCRYEEYCISDADPNYDPNGKRVKYDGVVECQRCDRWGEDCKVGGQPRFNTACARFSWYPCGRTTPPKSKGTSSGKGPGPNNRPIEVPDGKPQPPPGPPPCVEPHIRYKDGTCGCPSGLRGEFCEEIIVH
jgi:hypothetical protein